VKDGKLYPGGVMTIEREESPIGPDVPMENVTIKRRAIAKRPLVVMGSVGLMAVILISSIGIFILLDRPNGPDGTSDDGEKGEMTITLVSAPEELLSGMEQSITGYVVDENGLAMGDASVILDFTTMPDTNFRTISRSDGYFDLTFWSPGTEEDENISFTISASMTGYTEGRMSLTRLLRSKPTWTFMVYMSDCDLEAWALSDLNEMEGIGSTEELNIVVQLDRWESISPKDDSTDGNWTTAKRFLVQQDQDPVSLGSLELEDLGEINSADPDELADFAIWAMDEYPADKFALVLWNHGSGIDGICWEQSMEEDDVITIQELGGSLNLITDGGEQPLDIIGFDACLMSTIEVAYEIAPFGRFLLGSEITEPNFGWDYKALGELVADPFMGEIELMEAITDSYLEQSTMLSTRRSMSLSTVDLSVVPALVANLDSLSNTINSAGTQEIYNMRIARKYTQPISDGHSSDAVDLKDYIQNIKELSESEQVKSDSIKVLETFDRAVPSFDAIQGISDMETGGLNGISVYSPDFKEVLDNNEDYDELKFASDTSWKETLLRFYGNMELEMEERVLNFDFKVLPCKVKDTDGDCLPDRMEFSFGVVSEMDDTEVFLGINVYNLRGDYINSTWLTLNVNSSESASFTVAYFPTEENAESGMYRIVAYLCLGNSFDPLKLQDYARSGFRWLEV
jgi:hypothetical protein